ncbi:MAG: Ig-like domain-containing protein [Prevotellaceae bacterium]|jgi:uncharacterized protein YjdB|nr:Ig-like domain-containing protein [Prevotellaceae bacterium]
MKRVFLFSLMTLVCIGMASCGDKEDEGGVPLTGITVSPPSLSLTVNNMMQLTATPVPGNATGVSFEWSSANESVATVDQTGLVTVLKLDSTVVTVRSGSISTDVPIKGVVRTVDLVGIDIKAANVVVTAPIVLPLDDSVRLIAAPVPENATNVTLAWTSADTEVATVDPTGLVTITGIGSTTITVTSGTVSKSVNVTGTIKGVTVQDASGEAAGIAGIGAMRQLSAIIDPAGTGDIAVWTTSNPNIATVTDLGEVTVVGEGIVTITATVTVTGGTFSADYTLSTGELFDLAIGYWTFDDPENPGKATKGTDLIINGELTIVNGPTPVKYGSGDGEVVTEVDVPSAGNIAVMGKKGDHTLEWQHQQTPVPRTFTMMWDTKFFGYRQYYAMYWNGQDNDANWFFRWRWQNYGDNENEKDPRDDAAEEKPRLTAGRGDYFQIAELPEGEWTPWWRVVLVIEVSADDTGTWTAYVDGKKIQSGRELGVLWMFAWHENLPIYFLSDGSGNDGDDGIQPVASIAVWNKALTEQEVASLGGVK